MSANELLYLRSIVQEEDVEKMELARRNQSLKSVIEEEEDRFQREIDYNHDIVDSLTQLMEKLDTMESKADIGILTACQLWEGTQNQPVPLQEVSSAALFEQEALKASIAKRHAELTALNNELTDKISQYNKNKAAIVEQQILLKDMEDKTAVKAAETQDLQNSIVEFQAECSELKHLISCHSLKLNFNLLVDNQLTQNNCLLHLTMAKTACEQETLKAQLMISCSEEKRWQTESSQAQHYISLAQEDQSSWRRIKSQLLVKLYHSLTQLEILTSSLQSVEEEVQSMVDQRQNLTHDRDSLQEELKHLEAHLHLLSRGDREEKGGSSSPSRYFEEKYQTLQSEVTGLRDRIETNKRHVEAMNKCEMGSAACDSILECKTQQSKLSLMSLYVQYASCHLEEVTLNRMEQREALQAHCEAVRGQRERLQSELDECQAECQELDSVCLHLENFHSQRQAAESEKRAEALITAQRDLEAAEERLRELKKTEETVRADLTRGREIRDKCRAAVERNREEQRERLYQQRKRERLEAVRTGAQTREYQQLLKEARGLLKKEDKEYQQRAAALKMMMDKQGREQSGVLPAEAPVSSLPLRVSQSVPATVAATMAGGAKASHTSKKHSDWWKRHAVKPLPPTQSTTSAAPSCVRPLLNVGKSASVARAVPDLRHELKPGVTVPVDSTTAASAAVEFNQGQRGSVHLQE